MTYSPAPNTKHNVQGCTSKSAFPCTLMTTVSSWHSWTLCSYISDGHNHTIHTLMCGSQRPRLISSPLMNVATFSVLSCTKAKGCTPNSTHATWLIVLFLIFASRRQWPCSGGQWPCSGAYFWVLAAPIVLSYVKAEGHTWFIFLWWMRQHPVYSPALKAAIWHVPHTPILPIGTHPVFCQFCRFLHLPWFDCIQCTLLCPAHHIPIITITPWLSLPPITIKSITFIYDHSLRSAPPSPPIAVSASTITSTLAPTPIVFNPNQTKYHPPHPAVSISFSSFSGIFWYVARQQSWGRNLAEAWYKN